MTAPLRPLVGTCNCLSMHKTHSWYLMREPWGGRPHCGRAVTVGHTVQAQCRAPSPVSRRPLTWHIRSQVGLGVHGSSPAVGSDPRSEPVSMTHGVRHQIKLTYGRRLLRLHRHLIRWVGLRRPGPFYRSLVGQRSFRLGHLDPAGSSGPRGWGQIVAGAGFITAPSMRAGGCVPPQGDEELARQGDDDRLAHPPAKRPTRSWNHRLSAEVGWFCSHSQASSTIVVRSPACPPWSGPARDRSSRSATGRWRQTSVGGRLPAAVEPAEQALRPEAQGLGPIPFSCTSMAGRPRVASSGAGLTRSEPRTSTAPARPRAAAQASA